MQPYPSPLAHKAQAQSQAGSNVFLCPFPAPGSTPSFLVADFRRRSVDVSHVAWQARGETPCSCCIVNNANGSRTIVLYDT